MKLSGMIFIFTLFLSVLSFPLEGESPRLPETTENASGIKKNQSGFETPIQKDNRNKGPQFSEGASVSPKGRKSQTSFSRSLPEDISNENFPDIIESFDYPNVPLMDLIQAIGKLTGLNFIIDPGVTNKKITILAPSQITVAEAYKAFLSALAANGYTVVKSGAFWKIMETKNALKDNTEIYSGGYFPNTDQLITRIIKLKYISAKEFSTSIKHLASDGKQISFHASSNTVIISDYGSVIERIMKLIRVMDVPGSEESVKIIPIIHAAATDLAQILNELLSKKTSATRSTSSRRKVPRIATSSLTKQSSGNIKVSHIIPDERTNSLIVSANKNGIERVEGLIKKLDTYVDPSRTGGIYVYNVLYGTAEQVYNTLMGIAPSKIKAGASDSRSYPRSRITQGGSRTRPKSLPSSTSPLFQNVTIMADANTNSLIISARNKYDFERVKAVLKKIDVPKDQVFVQAIIVEMFVGQGNAWETNLIKALTDGVTKKAMDFLGIDAIPIAGFSNKSLSPSLDSIKQLSFGPGFVLGLPLSKLLHGSGLDDSGRLSSIDRAKELNSVSQEIYGRPFSELTDSTERGQVKNLVPSQDSQSHLFNRAFNFPTPLLQILKEVGDVNVLSTPQITALDNVTAVIEVGENAPVGLTNTSSGGLNVNNSVERADVTLKMELTPRINPDSGIIQMDIMQQFDDFSSTKSSASELRSRAVHITKRNIETKLVLHDGETAVLGGLMTDKEVRNENKVPFLGDIPILGWLFKGSTVTKQKRNLIIFLTPTIIRGKNQKNQARRLLGKKLEERIEFIKKNMKGVDPHGNLLKKLTATTEAPSVKPEGSEEIMLPKYPIKESPKPRGIELIKEKEPPQSWEAPTPTPEEPEPIQPEPFQQSDILPSDQIPIHKSPEEQEMELIEESEEEPILIPEESQPVKQSPFQERDNLPNKLLKQESPEEQEIELIEESEEESEESPSDSEEPSQTTESLLDQALRQDLSEPQETRTIQRSEKKPPQLLEELNLIEIFPQTPGKSQPSNKPEKSSAKKK